MHEKNQGGREVGFVSGFRRGHLKIKGGREVGRFDRLLVHIFKFWRVLEKTQGGREVRFESGFSRGVSQNQGR